MQMIVPKRIGPLPSVRHSAVLILLAIGLLLSMPAAYSQGQAVETGLIKLPDANIEYFSRGEGEPIVLLPGGTLTVGYLDGLAEALTKAGYRVVGINFRGSGKSTGSSTGVTLNSYADDVAGVIKALNLGPVHLAGNDFGNRVARLVSASHPELTRSVILLAAGGKIPPEPAAMEAMGIIFNPTSTDAEILAVMPYFVSDPAQSDRIWAIFKPSRATGAAVAEDEAMKSTQPEAWWAPPGDTKYLILQGAEDQIAPPQNGVELKGELGDRATLVNVPGAAHLLPLEQPDIAASHIIDFIRTFGGKPQ
jgi:pimeloyl-ACP methyl ester carboxylesterase